jgi:hypothetical protein
MLEGGWAVEFVADSLFKKKRNHAVIYYLKIFLALKYELFNEAIIENLLRENSS